jgi:DNA-binding MarR family transcriptional regulator
MHALLQLDPDVPQSMSSLAGAWKCDASNVTWLVDRLEERGLAERRAHPGDRRIRTVALTRKGVKVRSQIEARMYDPPDSLRALSNRDLETLARVLHKIVPQERPHG